MNPIDVALVNNARPWRKVGIWSYPVPQFRITPYPCGKTGTLDRDTLARKHHIIFHEDARCWVDFVGGAAIPYCYFVTDSTLSKEHYQGRRAMAAKADVVFVDWDKLNRFPGKVCRLGYSVNDAVFYDRRLRKAIDIGFYAHRKGPGGERRIRIDEFLQDFSAEHSYTYNSQIWGGADFAVALNQTKIVVVANRNPATLSYTFFDGMASRACMLTDPLPYVSGGIRTIGTHYLEWHNEGELGATLKHLLESGEWERYANAGHELIFEHHTWTRRAEYLYAKLREFFPWLKD